MAAPFDPNIYGSSILARARWVLAGGYVEPDKAIAAFDRIARRDAIGTRIHAALAIGTVAALMGPTSVAEVALGPILVFFFVRTFNTFGTWVHWFGQPLFLLALAWAAWQGASLLWSDDRVQGLDELGRTRWALVGVLLWPVIHARRRIVIGLAVGVALGQAAQVLQFVEQRAGAADPWFVRDPRRVSGWWDPVVAGSVLTGAVGLHLAPALFGRGRVRVVASAGLVAALIGVVATGTRGAWIASGSLLVVTLIVGLGASRPRPHALVIGAVAAGLAGAVLWVTLGSSIASRVVDGRREVAGALRGDYSTDTGRRVLMARRATEAIVANPIGGVGAGGYASWASSAGPMEDAQILDHAHSAPLHIGATTGLVGLGLAGLIVLVGVRGGLRGIDRERLGTYDVAPIFAVSGLLLAGAFDAVHLNTHTAAMLWVLLGLCPGWRPEFGADAIERRVADE